MKYSLYVTKPDYDFFPFVVINDNEELMAYNDIPSLLDKPQVTVSNNENIKYIIDSRYNFIVEGQTIEEVYLSYKQLFPEYFI